MDYLLNRFKEATTWQGLIAIVTGLGVSLSPEMSAAIVSLGVAAFGLISIFIKERGAKDLSEK